MKLFFYILRSNSISSSIAGDMLNNAINQNFDAFMKELSPIIEQTLAKFLLTTVDGITESFPFDSLFTD